MRQLEIEFERWRIDDWETNYPKGASREGLNQTDAERTVTLRYVKNSKTVNLTMGLQARAVDNLRVLFLAIESMRLNEKRGINDVLESAYIQLAAPVEEKNPWEVLQVMPYTSVDVCEAVYKALVLKHHPDKGGDPETFKQINSAIEKIRKG